MIRATAPVRICDIGGWTDTWFGGPGRVLNIAVRPGVEVVLEPAAGVGPNSPSPLVQAALDTYPAPVEVTVRSGVPAGCGAGTSAAVAVAVIGALAAARGETMSPPDVAAAAHRLETEVLGRESGVQDQLCSALGGVSFIEIDEYPSARVEPLPYWAELDHRLSLIFLGRPHDSSAVHRQVIERAGTQAVLARLREAAMAARAAWLVQDLSRFGEAMIANTEAQADLHPDLVGEAARRQIEAARRRGALGWKVNGAGGDGGSLTVLYRDPVEADAGGPGSHVIPVSISRTGLEVSCPPTP